MEPTPRKPLRLWPGLAIAALIVLARFAAPLILPDIEMLGILAAAIGGVLILLWWLLFSRAPWLERLGAIALIAIGLVVTLRLVDRSIATGHMGMMLPIYSLPAVTVALVVAAAISAGFSTAARRATMAMAILIAFGFFTLLRTGGISGEGVSELHWRWTPSPEDRLIAQGGHTPGVAAPAASPAVSPNSLEPQPSEKSVAPAPGATPVVKAPATPEPARAAEPSATSSTSPAPPRSSMPAAEWPGFRGGDRDSIVHAPRIATDWTVSPPVEVWRRPIGPGWSSFAVRGDLIYTQEQRGESEVVSCYKLSTGEPVWRHGDRVRFWESNAGAGPRGTPTLDGDRVYAFGATGVLNALDARTGARAWSRDVAKDLSRKIPDWGFTSSPLVIDDIVVVAASGTLAAYDVASGKPRWVGPRLLGSYSSPHRATVDGVTQILLLTGSGVASVSPANGSVLWQHEWKEDGATIVQPALTPEGDILINASNMMGGVGLRRLAVSNKPAGWTIEERWTSTGLKPYFNDFIVHKGHAYGFDGTILSCIDLADGRRKWKGGRYGHGQLVLLPEQDLMLVLSEEGELALVKATPDQFTEVGRVKAIEGKTWNHPVVVGNLVLVRNGEEMAAFRLIPAGS
jgi:outer membrane protein assembly factor BamB